jgi:hypothetical protein
MKQARTHHSPPSIYEPSKLTTLQNADVMLPPFLVVPESPKDSDATDATVFKLAPPPTSQDWSSPVSRASTTVHTETPSSPSRYSTHRASPTPHSHSSYGSDTFANSSSPPRTPGRQVLTISASGADVLPTRRFPSQWAK